MKQSIMPDYYKWKDIEGYEGLYQVNNIGQVRSLKFINGSTIHNRVKILKQQERNGYLIVQLRKNTKRRTFQVHRLVANAFIENPNNYNIVNHIDYDKHNNNVSNLEWCTQKYNVRHSICNMKGKLHISKIRKEMYGITYRQKYNIYELTIKGKYYGRYKQLGEAIRKRDEMLNELNIAM